MHSKLFHKLIQMKYIIDKICYKKKTV